MIKTLLTKIMRFPINMINDREYFSQKVLLNERTVEYRFVFDQLAKTDTKRVLDVGTGATALPALIRQCGYEVTAIDNIRDFWPTGMFNRYYKVLDQDILNPNLEGFFDLITCISVLEHVHSFEAALREMIRLMNPKGLLVLTFPYCERQYVENVYLRPESDAYEKGIPYMCHIFSRKEISHWLEAFNLDIVIQEYWQFCTGPFWSEGKPLFPPRPAGINDPHQITCLSLKKKQD